MPPQAPLLLEGTVAEVEARGRRAAPTRLLAPARRCRLCRQRAGLVVAAGARLSWLCTCKGSMRWPQGCAGCKLHEPGQLTFSCCMRMLSSVITCRRGRSSGPAEYETGRRCVHALQRT